MAITAASRAFLIRERMKTMDKTMERLLPFVGNGAATLATRQKAFEKSLEVGPHDAGSAQPASASVGASRASSSS